MTERTTFDPDALRKEFADYCTDVEPGIKAKAPRLNQLETLALIGMTLFQAAKELKADKADQAARIAELEASLQASRRAALEDGPCRGYVRGLSKRCWNDGMLILDAEDWCTINNLINGTHTETDPESP